MLMLVNQWNDNGGISNVADGTQPNVTNAGTVVTAAANAYGSYATLIGSPTAYETYWIDININSAFVSADNFHAVVTIGVDPAGGTAFVDKISHLLCGKANLYYDSGEWQTGGGVNYSFPLRIPAGATIGAKASFASIASRSGCSVIVKLRGKPSRPDLMWAGNGVETLGSVSASTWGTAVTPGTAAEGAWTSIGTPTKRWRYAEWGIDINDSVLNAIVGEWDVGIGDVSNKRVVGFGGRMVTASNETLRKDPRQGHWIDNIGGATAYLRGQVGGGATNIYTAALYGVY